jgi:hypothetical protein
MIVIMKEDTNSGDDLIRICSTMSCLSRLLHSVNVSGESLQLARYDYSRLHKNQQFFYDGSSTLVFVV